MPSERRLMLFNSYPFVFIFLPVALAGFYLLGRVRHNLAIAWLTLMSLIFYAAAGPWFLSILLSSTVFNYGAGILIARAKRRASVAFTITAISIDLIVLSYFKYANFAVDNASELFGLPQQHWDIVLPIGISFYTFTQIAFLVDTYTGKVRERGFLQYALFVSYFPHLIAGPILHHAEMIPQFKDKTTSSANLENITSGLSLFVLGLAKKLIIADTLAPYADQVFDAKGAILIYDAWVAALAYTMQIYFDFSGYCDMAIGLSRMFNINLPINFFSPYKATNIIDFWRRWHITLSRFLRDYLYIALGGNRRGTVRRYANLIITMLLGGLWHGAAWTYVVWGGLHGLYLLINHAYRAARGDRPTSTAMTMLSTILTLSCVVVAWVFFRATSVERAIEILRAAASLQTIRPGGLLLYFSWEHVEFSLIFGGCLAIVWLLPNSMQMFKVPNPPTAPQENSVINISRWAPTPKSAIAYGALFTACVLLFERTVKFIYFQF
jgi:alginate O-acetyltransferase complex protein AlgI